jgi:hypothetical protein
MSTNVLRESESETPGVPHKGVHHLPPLLSWFLLNAGVFASRSHIKVSLRYGIMLFPSFSWLLTFIVNEVSGNMRMTKACGPCTEQRMQSIYILHTNVNEQKIWLAHFTDLTALFLIHRRTLVTLVISNAHSHIDLTGHWLALLLHSAVGEFRVVGR